jgi:transcriptional regulator with XRE-family HTH domain
MKEVEMDLQELRLAKGKSRQDVANKLGVSVQTISGWESGAQGIEAERVPEVAKEYGTTPQQVARYIIDKARQRKAARREAEAATK